MKKTIALCALLATAAGHIAASTATFDSKDTSPLGYYKPGTGGNQNWTDNGITFGMTEDLTYGYSWEGFAYSDVNDTVHSGYTNQYAVYGNGKDYSGSGAYAVGYVGYSGLPTVSFASAVTVSGFFANNTTYAVLDMLNGSGFSKQFTANDWFKLHIEGFDSGNASQGAVDFYLADFSGYTDGANRENFMVTDWAWVDLTGLGSNVSSLQFSMSSSDNDSYGYMNTPSYFAIDNMQAVPEPASVLLTVLGGLSIIVCRRARKSCGIQ